MRLHRTLPRIHRPLLLLLLLTAGGEQLRGQGTSARLREDSVQALLQQLARSSRAPAISVAIARRGEMVVARGQAANGFSVGPATMYRIGSLTKLFTAAAAARLWERGKLDLDADVHRYVPEYPAQKFPITLRQLAGHQSGIRHYGANEFISRTHFDSIAPTLAIFRNDSLLFEPGTKYFYSSYGFNLLGLALERASRMPYLTLIHDQVLRPLSLHQTAPDRTDSVIPDRVPPMNLDSVGTASPAVPDDLSDRWPSGGLLASVADLARFGSAFVMPGFLADSTIRMMTTPQHLRSGAATIVGIGWRVGVDSAGRRIWHHAGSSQGGRSLLVVWPAEQLVVAIAANATIDLSLAMAFRFADVIR